MFNHTSYHVYIALQYKYIKNLSNNILLVDIIIFQSNCVMKLFTFRNILMQYYVHKPLSLNLN